MEVLAFDFEGEDHLERERLLCLELLEQEARFLLWSLPAVDRGNGPDVLALVDAYTEKVGILLQKLDGLRAVAL